MQNTSQIELSKSALKTNYDFLKKEIEDEVQISAVVKGNAYGHGIEEYIPMAEAVGFNHFSVFSAEEAFRVKKSSTGNNPIMIMGEISDEDLHWVIENDIHFFVFELIRVEGAVEIAKKYNKKAKIHIELETGFNRTGFSAKGLVPLAKLIKSNSTYLSIEGACTHYAGAESIENHERVRSQITTFNKLYDWLVGQGIKPKVRHTACSAAAMIYPETRMEMVRIGILQYGLWPSQQALTDYFSDKESNKEKFDPLKRIISWYSKVMSIKSVNTGEFIGYGSSFLAQQNMKIAVIPVGYAYGYSRELSNQGRLIINGRRVGVVGRVNMNMIMVDISDIEGVKIGTKVMLIGGENGLEISIASFGELSNQLNYELLTRLPMNTPRIIVD